MINLIQKGLKIKRGEVFPLINIPINGKGREVEFTDFQWWAPTDKWDNWLKSNPRAWQAESEEYREEKRKLYESLVEKKEIDPLVLDFEGFNAILEEESSILEASEEDKKAYTKFTFAYNKLLESGKMSGDLDSNTLQKGSTYAIVADIPDSNNQPILETRQAYKMKIISDLANGYLAFCDESLPYGKLPESSNEGNSGITEKIAQWAFGLAAAGVALTSVVGAVKLGSVGVKSIFGRFAKKKLADTVIQKGSEILAKGAGEAAAKQIASNAGRVAATELELATGVAGEQLGVSTVAAETAGLEAATLAGGETVTASAGLGTAATTGIILAAVVVAWEIGQRLYNWTSDKQAPRLSEIEDEGWAVDMFMPGTIPDGEQITICWTQSSGNNWFENLVWNEDTRTTMDLIKLGNFNGRSVFILVKINSKEFQAVLKSKEMILLSFDQGVKVDRGFFDNDELIFEMIEVEKGDQSLITGLIFQGICPWEDMEGAYKDADEDFIATPENAPEEYSFHFKYGKEGRDVNVTGTLIKDLDSLNGMGTLFKSSGSGTNESEDYNDFIKALSETSDFLSFSEFSKITRSGIISVFEEDAPESSSADSSEGDYFTETSRVAAYSVESIDYADPKLQGQELPQIDTFIVPNSYLEAKDQESIVVEPMQEVEMKYPKKGTVIIETEIAEPPILAPTGGTEDGEDSVTGGVPVEVTKGEIKIKHRDDPDWLNAIGLPDIDKIKDKDKDDKIALLDFITPEEKEQLGMEDWEYIKKVKIYKDGKTGEPYMIKFKSGGAEDDRKRKIKSSDPAFETALKVAERIQSGFKQVDSKENEED